MQKEEKSLKTAKNNFYYHLGGAVPESWSRNTTGYLFLEGCLARAKNDEFITESRPVSYFR